MECFMLDTFASATPLPLPFIIPPLCLPRTTITLISIVLVCVRVCVCGDKNLLVVHSAHPVRTYHKQSGQQLAALAASSSWAGLVCCHAPF